MRIQLVFPPQWDPLQPYLSLPSLTAYLHNQGFAAEQRDLNVEAYDAMLSPDYLRWARDQTRSTFAMLDGADTLLPDEQQRYRAAMQALLVADETLDEVEEAKAVLRDKVRFYDLGIYRRAQRTLGRALRLVSAAHYPTKITLSEYQPGLPLRTAADLEWATDPSNGNLFYNLFERLALPSLRDRVPDILGISIVGISQIVPGLTLARMVKSTLPETHVTIGGSIFTRLADGLDDWGALFDKFFDSVIVYEGEMPLTELCRALAAGRDLRKVPNAVYSSDGCVIHNPIGTSPAIDALPTPTFDGLPLDTYLSPEPILPLLSSRGCYWGKCAFCDHGEIYRKRHSQRSPAKLVQDLSTLSQKYGVRHVTFNDESIAPRQLGAVSEALENAGLHIRWNADARLERGLTFETLQKAYRAGLRVLYFGLESGNDRVLKHMAKGINVATARSVLQSSARSGIWNHAFVFFGFPGETETEGWDTITFLLDNHDIIHSVGHTTFLLTPRSPVMERPQMYGITEVTDDECAILGLSAAYTVSAGMSRTEAGQLAAEFERLIRQEHPGWPIWSALPREHLLLYVSHYETTDLAQRVEMPAMPPNLKPRANGITPNDVPSLLPGVRAGQTRFDLAQMDTTEGPLNSADEPLVLLWDFDSGRLVSVTPSAAVIALACDGQRSIGQISAYIANEYGLAPERALQDCLSCLEALGEAGICLVQETPRS
jgi:anaerobic magnesium-protoporphyrin IX monomethyl ester cyclase